jgi:hypothetical protein
LKTNKIDINELFSLTIKKNARIIQGYSFCLGRLVARSCADGKGTTIKERIK